VPKTPGASTWQPDGVEAAPAADTGLFTNAPSASKQILIAQRRRGALRVDRMEPGPMKMRVTSLVLVVTLAGCAGAGSSPVLVPSSVPSGAPIESASPANETASPAIAEASLAACNGPDSVGCLARAIKKAADDGRFAGSVLIAKDGEPIWQGAFSEPGSGRIQLDTPMSIASAGKMFTAVSVAQLREAGKLDFDSRVGAYVPDLPPDVAKATISQLLSHTSGMSTSGWIEGLTFEPGTFNYSNAGFNLLAQVVERVSDQVFADYLEANLFAPAEMSATGFDQPQPRGAPLGLGGEQSTVADLLRFSNALFAYRFVGQATTAQLTSSKTDIDTGGYGYGFAIFTGEADEVPSVGHIGLAPPLESAVEMNPSLGYTVIVLSDHGFDQIDDALITFQKAIGMGYWRG
jgi:CubicO group peptidase (beta-lactamase class C family)